VLEYQQQTARPFGERELSRGYNIKLDITKLGYKNVKRINVAQDIDHWQVVTKALKSLWAP